MNKPETRATATIEDYLGVIYVMERDGEPVIAARLSDSLKVSPPTVTVTLKRMARDGLLTSESGKEIHLTETGRSMAQSVMRRHMLTEWMLTRLLNVPWSQTHREAHQIEHTISDEVETRLLANLEDPQLCPHGNPLPGYENVVSGWIPLTRVPAGQRIILHRIHESAEANEPMLKYLEDNGLMPGCTAQVLEVLPFNQTLTLETSQGKVLLGFSTAQHLFVEIQ
jgi:DtxR family Mn-dependent transcriptional regulator